MYHLKPAGFWIRFLAMLVDGVISLLLTVTIASLLNDQVFFNNLSMDTTNTVNSVSEVWMNFIYPIIFVIFLTASRYKGSPGKLICGIQVLTTEKNQISLLRSVGRYFAYFLSALPLAIGFMIAGWNEEKKALHDMICGTRVVYRQKNDL